MNPDQRRNLHEVASARPPESDERAKFYLHPGQLFVSSEGHAVTTILGSCVAVCLCDPVAKIGGINHFLLPVFNGDGMASSRFGDVAIQELVRQLLAHGSRLHMLQAKIFGGACVLEAFQCRQTISAKAMCALPNGCCKPAVSPHRVETSAASTAAS